ncbi:MAG: hemerythrin domain-containing protein [Chloroflexi bacterium]|nr:hemerythrin domain-containing protein [Chloroflexota bacterium]MDA1270055.1 hemerythrin domain-containing protein [Chloroflexota bacterium]PKB58751.1 MAG: hypothetical protein BZY83_05395 [SAR202 cluster bacterium Casp-Chloro-G2]
MSKENFTPLEHPIDVMPLMHKAFRAVTGRTEAQAAEATTVEDIAQLNEAFGFWVEQIRYHAAVEDELMTGPLKGDGPVRECVRDNEDEHAVLAGKAGELARFIAMGNSAGVKESVRAAAFTLEEEQHKELEDRFHEVEDALCKVLGDKKVTARTIRHIHSRVMRVRILELDHFENEEAFVCPLVRDEIDEAGQLYIVRRLLIDDSAKDPRWVIDWVHSELDEADQALLEDLEARFQAAVVQPA